MTNCPRRREECLKADADWGRAASKKPHAPGLKLTELRSGKSPHSEESSEGALRRPPPIAMVAQPPALQLIPGGSGGVVELLLLVAATVTSCGKLRAACPLKREDTSALATGSRGS